MQAFGTGGRKARTDVGDAWDHFLVTFWYPNDVRVDFSSSQFIKGYHDMCIRFYGTKGTMDSHYGGSVKMTGDNKWDGTEKDDTFTGGAVTNVKNFVESVRTRRVPEQRVGGSEEHADRDPGPHGRLSRRRSDLGRDDQEGREAGRRLENLSHVPLRVEAPLTVDADQGAVDRCQRGAARQPHRQRQLRLQQLEYFLHARLAEGSQPKQRRASD